MQALCLVGVDVHFARPSSRRRYHGPVGPARRVASVRALAAARDVLAADNGVVLHMLPPAPGGYCREGALAAIPGGLPAPRPAHTTKPTPTGEYAARFRAVNGNTSASANPLSCGDAPNCRRVPRLKPFRPRHARLAALLVVPLLAACGQDDVGERLFPLEPGREWQYRVVRTTMDGTRELRHIVRAVDVPPGSELSGLRTTLDGRRLRYVRTSEGLFRLGDDAMGNGGRDGPGSGAPRLVLPDTPAPGARWQSRDITSVLENTGPPWETLFRITVPVQMHYEVLRDDATLETPAGRFERCLLLEGHGSANADVGNYIGHATIEIRSREWFAPDVGLVRLERDERTDAAALSAGRLVMELDRWHH